MNTTCTSPEEKLEVATEETFAVKPRYVLETRDQDQTIQIELPGVLREHVAVNLEKNILKVSAKRLALIPKEARVLHRELHSRDYELRVRLDAEVDEDRLRAVLLDGVLTIYLPRRESARIRNITVQ